MTFKSIFFDMNNPDELHPFYAAIKPVFGK